MILSAAPEVLKRLKKPGRREPSRVKIGSGPAGARRKLSVKADSSLCRTLRVRRRLRFYPPVNHSDRWTGSSCGEDRVLYPPKGRRLKGGNGPGSAPRIGTGSLANWQQND